MESPLKIQPKLTPLQKPLPDKQQLLLLGLQLLNKGLKLPTAVVQPQVQRQAKQAPPVLSQPLEQSSPVSKPESSEDESEGERGALSPIAGRKRKRNSNDDLSEVQKKEKRKMMNRVAAQNARDRKKAYVEDLERKVALLEGKNKQLLKENTTLKERTTALTEEKCHLEKRLAESIQSDLQPTLVKRKSLEDSAIRSAAPNLVSLQQKQISKALLFQVWMSLVQSFWLSLKKASPPYNQLPVDLMDSEWSHGSHMTSSPSNKRYLLREEPWWGASETEWNPPKN